MLQPPQYFGNKKEKTKSDLAFIFNHITKEDVMKEIKDSTYNVQR